jgi:hypothetical protein
MTFMQGGKKQNMFAEMYNSTKMVRGAHEQLVPEDE